jgi:polyphosphate kinase
MFYETGRAPSPRIISPSPRPAGRPAGPAGLAVHVEPDPAAALLARLMDGGQTAPPWLEPPVHLLAEAQRNDRPLRARLADVVELLGELEKLFTVNLAEVRQWFQGPEAHGRALQAVLPRWTEMLFAEASVLVRGRLLPELAETGVQVVPVMQVDEWQRGWLHRYFSDRVYPLLTPLAVDSGRPFPFISSESLNLLVELRRPEEARTGTRAVRSELMARVKIPPLTPRLIAVPTAPNTGAVQGPAAGRPQRFVHSADLVRFFVHHLFTGMPVRHVYLFRIVRGESSLPDVPLQPTGRHRRHGNRPVVRLDVERRMEEPVLEWLMAHLQVPAHGVARHESLLEWTCVPALLAQLE